MNANDLAVWQRFLAYAPHENNLVVLSIDRDRPLDAMGEFSIHREEPHAVLGTIDKIPKCRILLLETYALRVRDSLIIKDV